MLYLGILIGIILALIILFPIFYNKCKDLDKESLKWRAQYIENHKYAVKHFNESIIFKSMLDSCVELINKDFGYEDNWQSKEGKELNQRIKDYLKEYHDYGVGLVAETT